MIRLPVAAIPTFGVVVPVAGAPVLTGSVGTAPTLLSAGRRAVAVSPCIAVADGVES